MAVFARGPSSFIHGGGLSLCAHVGLTDCDTDGPGLRAEGVALEVERASASVVSPAERFAERAYQLCVRIGERTKENQRRMSHVMEILVDGSRIWHI